MAEDEPKFFITLGVMGIESDLEALVDFATSEGMTFLHGSGSAPDFEGWPARADALAARVEVLEAQRDEALPLIERLASPNARSAARTEEGALIQIKVEQIAAEARRILSGEQEVEG